MRMALARVLQIKKFSKSESRLNFRSLRKTESESPWNLTAGPGILLPGQRAHQCATRPK